MSVFLGPGMPSASLLVNLLSALLILFVFGETEIRFTGQTEFVVNETSTTVIRLIIERIGEPANVTAIVSLYGEDAGDFFDTYAAAFIPAGETNRTVYIAVCDDDLPEPDETFIFHLTLQKPSANVKLGWPRTVTVTILSNDNAFGIISFNMLPSIAVSEPKDRNESMPLTLIREKGTYGMVMVTFEVEGGPNPPDEDLSPVKGNITFPPGKATVIYNLTVLDDEVPENDEIFLIQLKSVEGGAEINTSRNSIEIIIKKNDSPVRFLQSIYLVPEEDHILIIPVVRGKDNNGNLIGSDEYEVSISYAVTTGNSTAHAQQNLDFIDLQPNTTVVFPPFIHESHLKFQIVDDTIPEIAESFHIMLLKDTLQGDAVLISPSVVQVTIKPNDKPYGVLSFNSVLFERTVIIDEDRISRYEEITVVRNGGTHGNVSANWVLTRNSTDPSPVTADIRPSSGVLHFAQGQMLATIPLTVVDDDLPEEAEAYLLQILPHTIRGGAEVSEPAELLFYIQDSDDVYGLITFFPMENQKIESSPGERYLSLSFTRLGGTKGDVRLLYSVLYIPAGAVDPLQAKEGILNISRRNDLIFPEQKTQVTTKLPIRNDAFLQNGAHFLVQLETVELLNIIPPIPPISPRFGEICNISLLVTPAIANGEIGFLSNLPIILHEPEDFAAEVVYIPLHRDGTDGQATVYWSLKPSGFNSKALTPDDIGPFNGSVLFLSGQSDTTINITIKGDDIPEMNETVTLSLDRVNVENQVLKSGYTSRDLIILENDDPGGLFEFSPASRGPYVIKEGESVELHIIRSRGSLVKQFLHYRVEPRDSNEFYGNTGVLEFKPGEREIVITLLARLDGIPELDEHYWVVLSSHGERESKLGSATIVNITILKNDDPHGIIEFVSDGLIVMINESKGDVIYSAVYDVVRNRGNFGDVSVSWVVSPDFTQDVFPVQGTVVFGDQEFSKNITIYSLPDEIPEEMEEFTVILLNATGGAKVGNRTTATLRIRRNDDPIYFAEPRVVRVQEGETANFTVLRNGSVDVTCMVQYATKDGKATARERDFIPVEKGETLIFEVGSRQQSISVFVNEDGIPETDEPFYIILFNSTGDTVVYQYGVATVIIEANDDPNGIFSLEPIDKAVEEGKTNAFWILRHRGYFGSVSVSWQLFQNDSALQPGQEFYETSGTVNFMDGEEAKPIILHAFPDKIPEFNEFYFLKLVNISGGSPGPGGQLAETNLQVTVMIPFNDDPFGVFILDPECLEREVAEDVLSEDDMSYITNFTILRQQGVFGDVRLGWEILSSEFPAGLPPMIDFLLVGIFPTTVHLQQHMRHHHSGTDALYFTGLEGAFGTVNPKYHPSRNNTIANFTFSAWVMPNANTNGFIIAKDDGNGSIYYGVKIQTNESHVTLSLHYKTLGSNATYIAKTTVMKYLEESVWLHLLIILEDGIIEFYLDGNAMPRGIKSLKGEAITDGPGILRIGAGINGNDRFTGLMQDVRSYERKLTLEEIYELHAMPAKSDLHPISGYLEFRQGETNKSFIISARDDNDEEGEELFILKLVSVYGGARISEENTTARLTIQKSDNANGLFGFTGACIPEVLNIYVLDDDIPELNEYFRVTLVSAIPGDGKLGSTPTSGASIDPEKETTDITIKASDHPYASLGVASQILVTIAASDHADGVFEFSPESLFVSGTEPEDGYSTVTLNVIRHHGTLSPVTLHWNIDSDPDGDLAFTSGNITFEIGQTSANITVEILPDEDPELDKAFSVSILSVSSGSLGAHINATLTVLASDDPYGIFIFSEKNRPVKVEEATQNITLSIIRLKGLMGKVLVSYATLDDMEKPPYFPPNLARATQGRDYIPASGFALFGANQSEATIAISILDDDEPERSESVFIELLNSTLVAKVQSRSIPNSPRLGPKVETVAQLIIIANDDAFGTLQLSAPIVRVAENHVGPIINVTRTGGAFADVSVKFKAVPVTAIAGEDYSIASSDVVLLEGETSKAVPIYVINDIYPELEESFLVQLMNETTGGARLGALTEAVIIIEASDDPYGLFGVQITKLIVEEPEFNSVKVNLPIIRNSGTLGNVTVQWVATINGQLATGDLRVVSGNVTFAPGETIQTLLLEVLADDVPEIEEVIQVQLTDASGGGTIGLDRIANIIIPANDNPYGTVAFAQTVYRVQEPLERSSCANITVRRSGGHFGRLLLFYSTSDIDVVALAMEEGQDLLSYYESPIQGVPDPLWRTWMNVSAVGEPLYTCATLCLKEQACSAFSFFSASEAPQCFWMTSWISPAVNNSDFWTYRKNMTRVASLFSGQAVAGSDYEPVTRQWAIMQEGDEFANLTVSILPDDFPEMDESFLISLLEVHLMNISASLKNQPTIGQPNISTVVIALNGDAFGVFVIYSISPNTSEDGLFVEVQEQPQTLVELTIHRTGGSLGQVAVEWRVVGGTATEGLDFIGAGEILTFAEGETKKTIILTILDDSEPEDDESIIVSLVYTEGGSRILPSSDTVRVNILANDNVAGIVSFQTASRSVIGHEGEILQFHVIRTFPGRGNVTVNWKIIGQNLELNFANFSGQLFFPEGSLNTTLFVHLLDDNIPEEKEVYQVILYDVRTQGVPPAGIALLDAQGYAAVLTVEASDEPHGVLNFALSSRFVLLQEANITIQLFINREFGSLGAINVTYTTVPGMLSLKNQTVGNLAEPEVDFVPIIGFLILEEGETAAAINITILEDDIPELEEYFLVNLTYVELTMAASTSFPPRLDSEGLTAQVIIDANDGARGVIEWQQSRFEVNETHGSLTLVAQRSREPLGHVSLFVYAQNLEAQVGLDYIFTPMILHFADGERYKNVNIMILDDDIPEGDEKFQLILTNPSPGLELGKNTIALIIVLANDDGPGVLSFNNSEHFFLREPTALYVQEGVAVLYIVREPAQGLFGTVTVQFIVTEVNSSNESKDLTPSKGYIVLEEGVRFKALQISAILDTEPEMDEYFVCTLFNPTGGARLGAHVQTLITVLQNQAPLGLFSISAVENRATSIDIEEANRTVYLNVSRTNGIDLAVSVQWETVSETAFGMRGMDVVFSVFQSFLDESASGWCFFTLENLIYGIMLRKSSVTVYRWQGIFIPVEDLNIENPKTCEAFNIGFSPYFVITHEERNEEKPSLNSVFTFTSGFKLFLVQTIIILESSQVRYFTSDSQDYLIIASQRDDSELTQVFRWNGGSFVLHQKLPVRGVLTVALFNKGGSVFLAISQANARLNSLLFRWSGSGFINFQEVPVSGTTEVEALSSANDIYLIFAKNVFLGDQNSIDIFIWEMGQSSFRYFQSLDFAAVNRIHSFTPASGIAHILLIGQDMSAVYCWNSELNHFSFVLEVPSAYDVASVTVKSLNSSKNLIALVGTRSHIYELAYISSHSDFIPGSGELIFEPGDREATIAVNILDDTVPEKEESFKVQLKNPKGGAEIGINDSVTITILSNDDAYGIVAFAQNSLYKQVEEMEQDSLVTLNVERLKGTYGRITIAWEADGSISDIFPTSGVISFTEGQVLSTITLTILADNIPELSEVVIVTLTRITTEGVEDSYEGATIDQDRSKSVITTLPNDSPFGLVGWHAASVFIRVAEPKENTTTLQLQLARDKGLLGDIAIHLRAQPNFLLHVDNQATENEDYVLQETIIIMKENIKEAHAKVSILPGAGEVITAYEVPPPLNVLQVPVVRLAGSFGAVNVYWKASPDSAGLEDFKPSHGILEFADKQVTAMIEIAVIDDAEFELTETFNISLISVAGGGRLGDDVVVTVVIPQNDSPFGVFGFEEKTVMIDESLSSDDPDSYVTLTVVRSPGGKGTVRLEWTIDEKAKHNLSPLNGTLHFDETESQKTIVLHTLQDTVLEEDRRFTIQLISIDEVEISPVKGSASIIIRGDKRASGEVGIAPSSRHILIGEPSAKYNGTAIISLVRGPGILGEVTVFWRIFPPSVGEFAETSGKLTMRDEQSAVIVVIQALNDDIPEEKSFYEFQLTAVSEGGVLSESSSTANITVVASDSPYGRFAFSHEQLRVSEAQRVNITIIRSGGDFGHVRLWYKTMSGTAEAGLDFVPAAGELLFEAGEMRKSLHVEILDDDYPEGPEEFSLTITKVELQGSEFEEPIEILLTGATGGAVLGRHLVSRIIIAKSDSPFGVIRFLNQSKISIPNPNSTMILSLVLERTGGLLGEIQIQKFGDPNGVVQFAPETLSKKTYSEPLALEGPLLITFFVRRVKGTFGEIMVYWELSSEFDITEDFLSTSGFFTIADGESEASFDVHLLPDEVPEIEEDYVIQLVSVEGGAELDLEKSITWFSVYANDDPHGVFALYSDRQSILIGQNLIRSIHINITRLAGTFGDVAVGLRISSDHKEQPIVTENAERQLVVKDGATYKVDVVPIKNQVFLSLGSNFTLQLVTVMLVGGRFYGMPTILQEAKSAVLPVSEKAANSQVGFESTAFQLMNITAGTSHVMISRRGTYGALSVAWTTGYAPGLEIPEFIVVGNMTPTLGSLSFSHGEQRKGVFLWTFPSPGRPEAFVLHLSGVQSSAPGGAQLRSGFIVAEIEPMGVFQFSTSSRNIIVSEDTQMIRLHVQRLFGFHSDLIKVSYQTTAGSAKPLEDFEPVQNGELFFQKFQTEVDFEITIINDQLSEIEEFFYINLTSVEIRGLQKFDVNWSPRLNLDFSVAVITILDNDDLAGMDISFTETTVAVAVDTTLIPVETESTTYLSTSKTTTILQPTNVVAIVTEATGVSAIPEKLVTLHGTPAVSEKPDVATVTANVSIHGTFSLGPSIVYVEEEMKNGTFNTAEVLIRRTGSDLHNGIIGFSEESQSGLELREGADMRRLHLIVTRQPNRAFEDVKVFWRVTLNKTVVVLQKDGINLMEELQSVSGTTTCTMGQTKCFISIELKPEKELRSAETIGRTIISPAISGKDFVITEGTLVFEPGQRSTVLDVILTPETGSLNSFPKRFQIVLFDPKGGARIDKVYGTANITLVSDADSQAIWGLADQLHQPVNDDILNRVLHTISMKVATENTDEQLSAMMHLIEKITTEGKIQAFSVASRTLFYEILCSLINPKRKDTRGFSHFAEVTENFAFSLLTNVTCGSPGEKSKTILDSCPYLSILALHWYPQQINGHKFEGKEGDYIQIPEKLLDVQDAEIMAGKSTCKLVQFTEYSSQQWFISGNNLPTLKNKVLSLSVKGQSSQLLTNDNEVLYRIYAAEPRIIPQTSLCLLWNQAAASWLSDSQFCKVVEETADYVECACSHMSVYAVYAQTDNLSSYNEAFFTSGFICISGLCLAVLSHIFCARYSMFAAKLLTHMMAASLGTQILFLASAYASPQLAEESCSAMAAVTHYLYLCQFSWMLIQSVNFWYVLVMNDEHTERRYLLFFLLSWGLPAFVVILLIVILKGIYHQSMSQIYGLIHGDLCFIPNVYAALFTAALVPLMCLVVVFVVFIHAYQVKPQWKAYDDIFRGRTNAAEIPLILYLFALISVTWLWGGLHMAYRHFWMLVLFVIFNSLQGLYVFVVYFILHNQMCCPMKASYTVEMNGHPGPSTAFFTPGSGMPPAGGEISKSTQNLISAMEEVPPDWERASFQQGSQASPDLKPSPQNGATFPSSGGYGQGSLIADEESQEFDDLIFALKTGAGLSVSDNESGQGSQEGGTLTDSQIVELRRIPIADTHL
ncbi:ADGRV1 isoform 11 [Pan troglodytes]|uniref:ADGRV1 isoform 11 n=1 Tax=Pan troglodytes TaxID=9598 RepID=A0A2J8NML4_PANTR|nr:ADGRV1 isoform 11 [Pan troglodytes]